MKYETYMFITKPSQVMEICRLLGDSGFQIGKDYKLNYFSNGPKKGYTVAINFKEEKFLVWFKLKVE